MAQKILGAQIPFFGFDSSGLDLGLEDLGLGLESILLFLAKDTTTEGERNGETS